VRSLRDRLHGDMLNPGDEGYEEARTVFNAMIEKYPSYVVRPTGAADVMAAVDFAREHDLPLSVRGGGHNFAGTAVCDDGLTIDCSPMDSVRVDPTATAFPHRDAAYSLGIWPAWDDPEADEDMIGWAREFHEAIAPYAEGVYSNYLDRDEGDRIETAYGENYDRLVEVKSEWDPENVFRVNQNVAPTG